MAFLNIVAGAVLLLAGRRLFWLFVACVGFVAGATLATEWFGERSDWVTAAIALGVGLVGAVLSVFLQRVVVALGGFVAGGYVAYALAMELHHEPLVWIAFLLGGVIGTVLMLLVFDWALIMLSALMGATVIAQNVPLQAPAPALLFVVLLVLGIVVQARQMKPAPPPPKKEESGSSG